MQSTDGTLRTFYRVEDWPVGCAKLALQGFQGGGAMAVTFAAAIGVKDRFGESDWRSGASRVA
jgi:hypothetical protein